MNMIFVQSRYLDKIDFSMVYTDLIRLDAPTRRC